jgi:transcriptional regulator with XRE-family HTH domain
MRTKVSQDLPGLRIKERRKEMGLSLRDLAAKTELTAAFISQVERGQTNPSLDSLRRIAEALQVSLMYFLSDGPQPQMAFAVPEHPAPLKYAPVVRANSRPKLILPVSGLTYELLNPDLNRKMEAFCGRLAPGTGNVARRLREPTEEFILVLSGALMLELGEEQYTLQTGDSIYFEGAKLQRLTCASEEEATWVSVITPPVF